MKAVENVSSNRIQSKAPDRAVLALQIYQLAAKCAEVATRVTSEVDLDRIAEISDWCVEQTEHLDRVSTMEVDGLLSEVNEPAPDEYRLNGYFAETTHEKRQRLRDERAENERIRKQETQSLLHAGDRDGLFSLYADIADTYAIKLRYRLGFDEATAEDIQQAGRLAVWKACMSFDPAKSPNFKAYVYVAMSRGAWHEWQRLKRQERGIPFVEYVASENGRPSMADELAATELIGVAYRKLKELPADTQVILAEHFSGTSHRELAARFGLCESSISKRFHWAVKEMQEMIFPLVVGAWGTCPCFIGDVWKDLEDARRRFSVGTGI